MVWFAVGYLLLMLMGQLPESELGSRLQVSVQASRTLLGLMLLLCWLGFGVGDLLLPPAWKRYELALMPLVGAVVFVPTAYYLNHLLDMRTATALVILVPTPLVLRRLLGASGTEHWRRELAVPVGAALGLVAMALLPHLVQGSLALLALNNDEETYFYPAQYLLSYPLGKAPTEFVAPTFAQSFDYFVTEGCGFQYLLAATSAVSALDTFSAYLPVAYALLGMGAVAWYLFFRTVLGLPSRAAGAAVTLYAIHGLPLWFASYGYARQTAWMALTPLVYSGLALAFRERGTRPIVFTGLAIAALMSVEARVGVPHMAVTLVGVAFYWLVADRRVSTALRLVAVVAVTAAAAAPALLPYVRSYVVSGSGLNMLRSGQDTLLTWGPGLSSFPSLGVLVGLEPNELVRIMDTVPLLAWLEPANRVMSAAAPYLTYAILPIVGIGMTCAAVRQPMALALTGGFLIWLASVRTVLPFPYGYLKLFGVAAPIILGFGILGVMRLWRPMRRQPFSWDGHRVQRAILVSGCLLVVPFLLRNSFHSIMFGAQGWGLSIPPSLVRDLTALASTTEPNSQVFITSNSRYPVPKDSILLRKDHRLAMQSKDELSGVWSYRVNSIVATGLIGRRIDGAFRTGIWKWADAAPSNSYDYYVLMGDDDPRLRALDPSDVVAVAGDVSLYRAPNGGRASAEQILAKRGTLQIDAGNPLVFYARPGDLSFDAFPRETVQSHPGRIRLGFLSLSETTIEVQVGDHTRRLALDSGLTWYTTSDIDLPTSVRVGATQPIRVVGLRELPVGEEQLDRSNDAILSSEVVADGDGVNVDLWFSNPMRDAKGAVAVLLAGGERQLALDVPERGQRWVLRFPLKGGGPQQLRDGLTSVPIEPVPWLDKGGGSLSLSFRLGREEPKVIPLAIASTADGRLARLDRFSDPAPIQLWGHDDRPKEKLPPDLQSLQGSAVFTSDGLIYEVLNGERHWLPDPRASAQVSDHRVLTPEQLWVIPPGLPLTP